MSKTSNWLTASRTQGRLPQLAEIAKRYIPLAYSGFVHSELWQDVETFCLFLGYPRSGHTLVGSLLNAHPHIAISHEADILKYAHAGYSRYQIYELILELSQRSADPSHKIGGGYNYYVPNQWQGRTEQLKVLGDKKGGGTTLRIAASPKPLSNLRKILDVDLKFVHVYRNTYDNISTLAKKTPHLKGDLKRSIDYYFFLCKASSDVKESLSADEIFEFGHEDFIDDPRAYLQQLCTFLGVEPIESYLADCAKVVYRSPSNSRHSTEWSAELIDYVATKMQSFPFLQNYTYND
ncbi:hypothetical protein S7335_4602 [Synechococcus sp. PCC 7335]|uniref:sulfotransferase family protein n=1 Tax=Synechococcus sp. (strain ATCC 29403 / PCC 7335) TaxID=91464 RepID=UPI00017ED1EE|nr:sulfotransferase [Synechococcus sp. PCC 7335]EDX86895.1 hypothetical protein S7335_4602 [Synechococcus sp. PCC 7335]